MNADHDGHAGHDGHDGHDEHDDHGLSTALRDRLDGVRPDLDRLVAVATRQGARMRRRTRLAVSLGSAAGAAAVVGAIAIAGSSAGSGSSGAPHQPGFADEPSFSSSAPPTTPSEPSPAAVTTTPVVRGGKAHRGQRSPVTLQLPGWSCTPPADEKFICSAGDRSVQVTWRPGSERGYWGTDPDKSAAWISDVHGEVFVTVDPGPGTPNDDAVTVGEALVWSQ